MLPGYEECILQIPVVLISTSQSASARTSFNTLQVLLQVLVLVLVQVKVLLVHVLVKERRQFHILSTWMLDPTWRVRGGCRAFLKTLTHGFLQREPRRRSLDANLKSSEGFLQLKILDGHSIQGHLVFKPLPTVIR